MYPSLQKFLQMDYQDICWILRLYRTFCFVYVMKICLVRSTRLAENKTSIVFKRPVVNVIRIVAYYLRELSHGWFVLWNKRENGGSSRCLHNNGLLLRWFGSAIT